jgi:hypothetical protein
VKPTRRANLHNAWRHLFHSIAPCCFHNLIDALDEYGMLSGDKVALVICKYRVGATHFALVPPYMLCLTT